MKKRLFDIVFSLMLLLVLSPILILISLVIITTDGRPIIFMQERVGRSGKRFRFFKFRTMKNGAEKMLRHWELGSTPEWIEYVNNNFKLKSDPRLIKVGGFLRRSSIDELPQLWNVLKGDMSLVGPRPLLPRELDEYGPEIDGYSKVKPGITGLWQVSGRSSTKFVDRVYYDQVYIEDMSLYNDIKIILKTVKSIFSGSHAY